MIQIMILVLSSASIGFLSRRDVRTRRWGFVFGLMGQPFWFTAAIVGEQWGILAVSLWFTWNHIQGIRSHFFAKEGK